MEMTQPLGAHVAGIQKVLELCLDGLGSVVLGDAMLAFGFLPLLYGPVFKLPCPL